MPVYSHESEMSWVQLPDRGLEVALVAHADPGHNHGEGINFSRAISLAKQFGATPIDSLLAYDLKTRYPEKHWELVKDAGSNHTWVTSTLAIYTGDGMKFTQPDKPYTDQLSEFGLVEERGRGMDHIIVPEKVGKKTQLYKTYDGLFHKYKEYTRKQVNEIPSFLYVRVPDEYQNKLNIVRYPNYHLNVKGSLARVVVDWDKVESIPREGLRLGREVYNKKFPMILNHFPAFLALPRLVEDGLVDSTITFQNPTLGFLDLAEGYGQKKGEDLGFFGWTITTFGEGVIIQRPIS